MILWEALIPFGRWRSQIESWTCFIWKRSVRLSPAINTALPCSPLNHKPKDHIHTFLEWWEGDGDVCISWTVYFNVLPPFCWRHFFPNTKSKHPLAKLEAISSCSVTCYLWEETTACLATTSFQVVANQNVLPEPPVLQADHTDATQVP